jgi:hypothetical protein
MPALKPSRCCILDDPEGPASKLQVKLTEREASRYNALPAVKADSILLGSATRRGSPATIRQGAYQSHEWGV